MALRAVPNHPKFARLKAMLDLPKGAALGYLEAIWHFTGNFTPQGNIGKYTDSEIESWVEWPGEPGALICALAHSGWLDAHSVHRLLVHDWAQHADKATKNALKRKNLDFIDPEPMNNCSFCTYGVRTAYGLPEPVPEPEPEPEPEIYASDDAPLSVPTQEEPKATSIMEGKKHRRARKKDASLTPWQEDKFKLWWEEYRVIRSEDKARARDAFAHWVEDGNEARFAKMMAILHRQKPSMLRKEREYRKLGSSWINARPWLEDDDVEEIQEAPRKVEKVAAIFRNRTIEQYQRDQQPQAEPVEITPERITELQDEAANSPIPLIRELAVKRLSELRIPEVSPWKN